MNPILFSFRHYHNWEQEDLAKGLTISLEEYRDLESGTNDPTHLSVIYSHCNFENSNGYVNHLYHDEKLAAAQEKEIQLLREEVKRLQNQNEQLLQSILTRK